MYHSPVEKCTTCGPNIARGRRAVNTFPMLFYVFFSRLPVASFPCPVFSRPEAFFFPIRRTLSRVKNQRC